MPLDDMGDVRRFLQMDRDEMLQQGMVEAQETLTAAMAEIQVEIERRRAEEWHDREQIRQHLDDLPEHQQREQFEQVAAAVENDVARVFNSSHEIGLVDSGVDNFRQAARDLVISIHSPVVQETLLLAVAPAYRDRVRDQMEHMGMLMWGWYELAAGIEGEHADDYILELSMYWDMDPEELRQMYHGGRPE